jgi:hypothetical protein
MNGRTRGSYENVSLENINHLIFDMLHNICFSVSIFSHKKKLTPIHTILCNMSECTCTVSKDLFPRIRYKVRFILFSCFIYMRLNVNWSFDVKKNSESSPNLTLNLFYSKWFFSISVQKKEPINVEPHMFKVTN